MKKILLASVLKPCDDTRIFEKFAISLSQKFLVKILARASEQPYHNNITFKSMLKGEATPSKRVLAWLKCLFQFFQFRPQIVIVHSPELLPVLFFYTLFSNCKTVYDVRENYYYNIKYQQNYKGLKKTILAKGIRYLESISSQFLNGYILAEKCYHNELVFHKKNYCIIENKFAENTQSLAFKARKNNLHFVFTGTISVEYGIWEALFFIEKLYKIDKKVRLTIAGHIVNNALKEELQSLITTKPYIELIRGNPLVPHQQIIDILHQADFALLPYQPNKSTAHCIPTKLYEALALKLPMLLQQNSFWEAVCAPYQAGIFLDFTNVDENDIYNQLTTHRFYKNVPGKEVLWETEEKKLMKFISEL